MAFTYLVGNGLRQMTLKWDPGLSQIKIHVLMVRKRKVL